MFITMSILVHVGGAADKSGRFNIGDQLLTANGVDLTTMSHEDARNFLKSLPDGDVVFTILPSSEH